MNEGQGTGVRVKGREWVRVKGEQRGENAAGLTQMMKKILDQVHPSPW